MRTISKTSTLISALFLGDAYYEAKIHYQPHFEQDYFGPQLLGLPAENGL